MTKTSNRIQDVHTPTKAEPATALNPKKPQRALNPEKPTLETPNHQQSLCLDSQIDFVMRLLAWNMKPGKAIFYMVSLACKPVRLKAALASYMCIWGVMHGGFSYCPTFGRLTFRTDTRRPCAIIIRAFQECGSVQVKGPQNCVAVKELKLSC